MKWTEEDVIALATKIHHLQEEIEGLNSIVSMLQSKVQIEKGKNLQLQSMIGHMNKHIRQMEGKYNIIDINLNYEENEEN